MAQREDVDTLAINLYLQLIDIVVMLKYFAGRRGVALCQRVHRAHQRGLRLAAQTQDGGAQRVELFVKMTVNFHV